MADPTPYEFNPADDATFLALARSAARVGLAGYGLGLALAAAGLLGFTRPPGHLPPHAAPAIALICLLGAVPPALAGHQLRLSARSLGAVATTSGDDVTHLMTAVDGLRRAFTAVVATLATDALGLAVIVALMFPTGGGR